MRFGICGALALGVAWTAAGCGGGHYMIERDTSAGGKAQAYVAVSGSQFFGTNGTQRWKLLPRFTKHGACLQGSSDTPSRVWQCSDESDCSAAVEFAFLDCKPAGMEAVIEFPAEARWYSGPLDGSAAQAAACETGRRLQASAPVNTWVKGGAGYTSSSKQWKPGTYELLAWTRSGDAEPTSKPAGTLLVCPHRVSAKGGKYPVMVESWFFAKGTDLDTLTTAKGGDNGTQRWLETRFTQGTELCGQIPAGDHAGVYVVAAPDTDRAGGGTIDCAAARAPAGTTGKGTDRDPTRGRDE